MKVRREQCYWFTRVYDSLLFLKQLRTWYSVRMTGVCVQLMRQTQSVTSSILTSQKYQAFSPTAWDRGYYVLCRQNLTLNTLVWGALMLTQVHVICYHKCMSLCIILDRKENKSAHTHTHTHTHPHTHTLIQAYLPLEF